ncbi:gamma-glutamyl-gamma-aminobutyrate hydrolase family protein [Chryseomicrobium palamuruense]|uniref:Gamma-glutamyl-gamma-aminobutyrate hydrolase family protein n=1 Tax=Chryseomicrobium palamuruense TaxID=682973 RepID=A0ABV8UV06_9BACL
MRPLIGIVGSEENQQFTLASGYVRAIEEVGGCAIYLPGSFDENLLETIHGFVLTGGGDIDPFHFEEAPLPGLGEVNGARDVRELELLNKLTSLRKPVLGICKGMQMLNVASGGTIYQDLYSMEGRSFLQHKAKRPRHEAHHEVNVVPGSFLAKWIGSSVLAVNSFHHQAVHRLGDDMVVSADASDGVVEAIEHKVYPWYGVQWHPETMVSCPHSRTLFAAFIKHTKELNYDTY